MKAGAQALKAHPGRGPRHIQLECMTHIYDAFQGTTADIYLLLDKV